MFRLIVAFWFLKSALAQTRGVFCPTVQLQDNFDFSKLPRRMYMERLLSNMPRENQGCFTADFSVIKDGAYRMTINTLRLYSRIKARAEFELLTIDANPAKMRVANSSDCNPMDLSVLKTDYNSYMILHMCCEPKRSESRAEQFTMLLFTEPQPDNNVVNELLEFLLTTPITVKYVVITDHNDCSYEEIDLEGHQAASLPDANVFGHTTHDGYLP